jgi:hypothetical protein
MILRTLAWKDGREVGLACAALLLCAVPLLWAVDVDVAIEHLLPGVTVAAGLMLGVVLLAGEAEAGTLTLLDWMSPRREPLWRTKFVLGLAAVVGVAAVLGAAVVARGGPVGQVGTQVLGALAAGLLGLAWGMLAGGTQRSVLRAASRALAGYLVTWMVLALLTFYFPGELLSLIQLLLAGGLLWAGERNFSRSSRRVAAPATLVRRPRGVLIWLWWRQARWAVMNLPALAFLAGLMFQVPHFISLWTLVALLLGWVCGLGVLGPEQPQAWAAWGQQGWPIRRLWLVKMCGWLAILAAALIAMLLGLAALDWMGLQTRPSTILLYLATPHVLLLLLFGAAWPFAITPLVILMTERRLPALFLSGGLSLLVVAGWFATILGGGVPFWLGMAGPLVLILGTRWFVSDWAAAGPSWPVRLKVGGWLAAVLLGSLGYFVWRGYEIPEVDVPLGAAAAPAPVPAEAKQAAADLQMLLQSLIKPTQVIMQDVNMAWSKLRATVQDADKPIPKDERDNQNRLVDQLFPVHLVDEVEKICAADQPLPAAFAGPILEGYLGRLAWQRLGNGLSLRAVMASEAGRQEQAWRCINLLLTLSRRVRLVPEIPTFYQANPIELEMQGYQAVARWLAGPPASAEVVARALADLRRHEAELPNALAEGQRLAAAWLRPGATGVFGLMEAMEDEIRSEKQNWRAALKRLEATLVMMRLQPWERKRDERRWRAVLAGWLEHLRTFDPRAEQELFNRAWSWDNHLKAKLAPLPTRTGGEISTEQLQAWSKEISYGIPLLDLARERTLSQAMVRGKQAQLAVLAYQLAEKRVPENLEQVVPRYLPAVPISPYSGKAFDGAPLTQQPDEPGLPRFQVASAGPSPSNPVWRWSQIKHEPWIHRGNDAPLVFPVPPWGLK